MGDLKSKQPTKFNKNFILAYKQVSSRPGTHEKKSLFTFVIFIYTEWKKKERKNFFIGFKSLNALPEREVWGIFKGHISP